MNLWQPHSSLSFWRLFVNSVWKSRFNFIWKIYFRWRCRKFSKFICPIIRQTFPDLITSEIINVQPMSGHIGQTFYIDYIYPKPRRKWYQFWKK